MGTMDTQGTGRRQTEHNNTIDKRNIGNKYFHKNENNINNISRENLGNLVIYMLALIRNTL